MRGRGECAWQGGMCGGEGGGVGALVCVAGKTAIAEGGVRILLECILVV